jgi:hypothetical protein
LEDGVHVSDWWPLNPGKSFKDDPIHLTAIFLWDQISVQLNNVKCTHMFGRQFATTLNAKIGKGFSNLARSIMLDVLLLFKLDLLI